MQLKVSQRSLCQFRVCVRVLWLRTRAWALWKATFELCQIADKNSAEGEVQQRIIDEVMNG